MSTLSRVDQLLRQALGDRRIDAADVLGDDLDLLAGDGVAVLLHVELDAVVDLHAGVGELARQRQMIIPTLTVLLRVGRAAKQRGREQGSAGRLRYVS